MEKNHHNDSFSIAVDKALLKLSKNFGIALPKDDYVLIQIFLNKEIIEAMMTQEVKRLCDENEKSKKYFRDALVALTKQHNEKIKSYEKIIRASLISSSLALIISIVSLITNLIGR